MNITFCFCFHDPTYSLLIILGDLNELLMTSLTEVASLKKAWDISWDELELGKEIGRVCTHSMKLSL